MAKRSNNDGKEMAIETIETKPPTSEDISNSAYNYQNELTPKLDNLNTDFDQNIINEIVLWKVNRYVSLDEETLKLVNLIRKDDTEINVETTKQVLQHLLDTKTKGVQLAMASTILRFKNPDI